MTNLDKSISGVGEREPKMREQKKDKGILALVALVIGFAIIFSIYTANFVIIFLGIIAGGVLWIAIEKAKSEMREQKESKPILAFVALVIGFAIIFSIYTANFIIIFFGIIGGAVIWIAMEDSFSERNRDQKNYKMKNEDLRNKIKCPSCGKKISRNSQFCTYCGEDIQNIIEDHEETV